MYGGSGKLGRGGGGGRGGAAAGKRNNPHSAFLHHPPPIHRPSGAPAGRLSVGGAAAAPRNRGAMTSGPGTSAPSGVEETFDLVRGNALDFAMIIRLAPDLVDEIKRVEAQGGTARIKFDSNANNPSGNVIDVGGKDFRFTWSHEIGDLCDIYEERQSGEDGNGLLVESGCAWRKLNVQRILDESTKNHVKKRSEEAERQQKSRKAIILEHGNPTKSQIKALAAAEANPWRKPFMKKEPEFKKRKVETHTVTIGGPPKAAYKSSLPATTAAKGRPSVSPLPSPPEHSGAPASPLGTGNHTKGHIGIEEVMPIQVNTKENNTSSEKEMPNRATSGVARVKPGSRGNVGAKPMDLQSMLILLLKENPKGMSVKALEKAIGDKIPNAVKKIEPIIKKIATFQAPGRYFLKQGVELENLKKPLSESGSSPEDDRHQTPAPENKQDDAPAPTQNFEEKVTTKEFDKQAGLNTIVGEQKSPEKVDTQNHSSDIFGDKKVSDNSEGPAGSSNDSGSDSDSESDSSDSGSDSGSQSRSRSKSRSPAGSGSASSSDSETDASSNSKQGPDEDVDIMTSDDDKELKPKSGPGLSASPIPWRTSDSGPVQNGIDEKQDANSSDVVEIEKDSPDDVQQTETAVLPLISNREGEKPLRDIKPFSPGNQERPENQVYTGILFGESESTAKDGFKHEQTGSSERVSRGKSKRSSDSMRHVEKLDRAKRLKAGGLPKPKAFRGRDSFFSESPQRLSPDRVIEDPCKGNSTQMINKTSRDGNADSDIQKGYNQGSFGKSSLDSQNSGRRPVDVIARVRAPESAERHGIHAENLGYGHGVTERNRHFNDGLPIQKDKICSEIQDENCYGKEKNIPRNSKEGAIADTHTMYLDSSYHGKHGEPPGGKLKEAGEVSNSHMGYSLKDTERSDGERSPVLNGRSKILQRELSDLELGELREPLLEETPGFKKEFDRKNSFKHTENRTSSSDYWNLDTSKGKLTGKTSVDSRKPSPPLSRVGVPNNLEGLSKKTPEHHTEDINRLQHHRVGKSQSQAQQHPSRVDRELDAYKSADMSGKPRQNEARVSQGTGIEGYGDTNRKASSSAPQQYDTKRGPISHPMKESRTQKSNMLAELSDMRKDTSLTESNEGNVKRRESSSDENSCSYSKYEKEEPELKGPIKDVNQYVEYVQEFHEKYDSYCSLNKILEGYRIEFEKLGKDLDIARERDMEKYDNIVNQLKESYRQCGTRHKRLKRIFSVLHEELQHMKEMMKDFAVLYLRD